MENNKRRTVKATSFGIELECVLAYRQDLLEAVISEYSLNANIIKTLTGPEHRSLMQGEPAKNPAYDRERYPSWTLHVPESDRTCLTQLHRGMFCTKGSGDKKWVRRLVMEPLLIAKQRLEDNGLPSNVIGWVNSRSKHKDQKETSDIEFPNTDRDDIMLQRSAVDYSKWTLTNDHTVIGVLTSQLQPHLLDHGLRQHETEDWDSYGLEMISPIYSLVNKKDALQDIGRYLDALNGDGTFLVPSVWTSTHIHIGFNFTNPEDIPLKQLQHLAYILISHETLLTKCHPRSRSGIPVQEKQPKEPPVHDNDNDKEEDEFDIMAPFPPPPTESELIQENDQAVLAMEEAYTGATHGAENVLSNRAHLLSQLPNQRYDNDQDKQDAIRDAIFSSKDVHGLLSLLQHRDGKGAVYRGYMYNFANILNFVAGDDRGWKTPKPTVEFRQHGCVIDIGDLRKWVGLVEGIVRKAERMASMDSLEERDIDVGGRDRPCRDIGEFVVAVLGLSEDEGRYWEGRYEMYKDDRPA